MAEPKTRPTGASVDEFIAAVADERRRDDCRTLVDLLRRVTGSEPAMWGPSIVGFGSYHYRYESGREGDYFLAGFSPRARDLTIYVMAGFGGREELLARLGPHKKSVSCLYVKRLSDLDTSVLEQLVAESVAEMRRRYL